MTLPAILPPRGAIVTPSAMAPTLIATIEAVIAEHKISRIDFFSLHRFAYLVAARRDAARRLKALGFSDDMIACGMKRDSGTIRNYCKSPGRRPQWDAAGLMARLAPEMATVVKAAAKAEEVTVERLLVRWIADRAEGEALHGLSETAR